MPTLSAYLECGVSKCSVVWGGAEGVGERRYASQPSVWHETRVQLPPAVVYDEGQVREGRGREAEPEAATRERASVGMLGEDADRQWPKIWPILYTDRKRRYSAVRMRSCVLAHIL